MPAGRFHKGFSSEKRMSYRPQALERMIENELFYQEAVKKKITIDEALVEKKKENKKNDDKKSKKQKQQNFWKKRAILQNFKKK